ncbi:hemerythrin domain-containing protein, partial [Streptomyces sp. NPDC005568]|uniref:hemerythrin domain-containing protein n=1 Tax=Streptomyces sp. NPDC005568 TaxID=3156887 RepID=UPI0033A85473
MPLEQRGIPLDRQLRNWRELNVKPIDPDHCDPYTRCRIIAMNGIEVEAIMFSHQLARNTVDPEVKRQLARTRYIEAQQQKVVNWLLPGVSSVLETTIAYEQVAVDLTAWVARMEPDPYLKQAYQFGVLEDFDHLYRYANLYEMIEHRKAESIVDGLTEVMPGRPTRFHHRNPVDNVRDPYAKDATDPLSKLHALTIMSAEQQTMNFYMNTGPTYMEPIARQLYQEIGLIEEEHVTHYESLVDPGETWWEQLVNHEYNECYLYYCAPGDDVVALLMRQHGDIRNLFDEVEASSGDARQDAFRRLVRLLAVHETAEEEVVHPFVRRN